MPAGRYHPLLTPALRLARRWCDGHSIDGRPALAHAARVASTLRKHQPNIDPQIIAAALVHDAPEFVPGLDVYATISRCLTPEVARLVREVAAQHEAMSGHTVTRDPSVLLISAADKIASIRSILERADRAPDPEAYWSCRQPFLDAIPHFRAVQAMAAELIPGTLAGELDQLVTRAEHIRSSPRRCPDCGGHGGTWKPVFNQCEVCKGTGWAPNR